MNTDELIATLAADTTPAPKTPLMARLALTCAAAAIVALILLLAWLGLRHDLMRAMHTNAFWVKAGYTAWLSLCGLLAVSRLARPAGRAGAAVWMAAAAVTFLVGVGALRVVQQPPAHRMAEWLGHSWTVCPIRILIISAPVFVGVVWFLRRLAPTRLRVAGAGAGLLAGAIGATVYGLACTETTTAFVATWYTLGIATCAAIGALLGPRVLRW